MIQLKKLSKNRKLKNLKLDELEEEKYKLRFRENRIFQELKRNDLTIQDQEKLLAQSSDSISNVYQLRIQRLTNSMKDLKTELHLIHTQMTLVDRLITLVRLRDDRLRFNIWTKLSNLKIRELNLYFREFEEALLDQEDLIQFLLSRFDNVRDYMGPINPVTEPICVSSRNKTRRNSPDRLNDNHQYPPVQSGYDNRNVDDILHEDNGTTHEVHTQNPEGLSTQGIPVTENHIEHESISLTTPVEQAYITIKPSGTDYLKINLRRKSSPVVKKSEKIKFSKIEIDEIFNIIPDPLKNAEVEDIRKVSKVISDLIPGSIAEEYRKIHPVQSLILDIDESLIGIPWEYMKLDHAQENSNILLEHAIGRVIHSESFEDKTLNYKTNRKFRFLIVCDPDCTLPATRAEASILENDFFMKKGIREKVSYTILQGPVTIKDFKQELETGDYNLVYFSGHSRYLKESSEDSYLKFSDGRFTAYQLKRLFEKYGAPQVFFANSCMSANEEPWSRPEYHEQVFGLASSFLPYGITYIGTLWTVQVSYAMIMMIEFFTHVMNGVSFGESIRRARTRVFADYGEITADWAAFILYGNPEVAIDWKSTSSRQAI